MIAKEMNKKGRAISGSTIILDNRMSSHFLVLVQWQINPSHSGCTTIYFYRVENDTLALAIAIQKFSPPVYDRVSCYSRWVFPSLWENPN